MKTKIKINRILFLNPPNIPFTHKSIAIEPVDILSLASYIQLHNYEVKFIDMDIEKKYVKDIIDNIELFKPDYIVITYDYHIPLHSAEAENEIINIIKICKQKNIKTIIGGKTSMHYPKRFFDAGVTIIIKNEMELVLKEIFNGNKLDEIKRVLKQEGEFYLIENDCGGEFEEIRRRNNDKKERTKRYNNWLLNNGFEIEKKFDTYFEFKDEDEAKNIFKNIWGKDIESKIKSNKIKYFRR